MNEITNEEEREVECESGNEYTLSCEIEWGTDREGEDADGNRGWNVDYKTVGEIECDREPDPQDSDEVERMKDEFEGWCKMNAEPPYCEPPEGER